MKSLSDFINESQNIKTTIVRNLNKMFDDKTKKQCIKNYDSVYRINVNIDSFTTHSSTEIVNIKLKNSEYFVQTYINDNINEALIVPFAPSNINLDNKLHELMKDNVESIGDNIEYDDTGKYCTYPDWSTDVDKPVCSFYIKYNDINEVVETMYNVIMIIINTYFTTADVNDTNDIEGKLSNDNDIANMQKKIGEALLNIINNLKDTYSKYWSIKYGRGSYYGSVILHDADTSYGNADGYNISFMISKDDNDKLIYRLRKTAVGSMGRNLYTNSNHRDGNYSDLNELWKKFIKNQFVYDSSAFKDPKLMDTIKF